MKRLAVVPLIALVAVGAVGCGEETSAATHSYGFVVGERSNSVVPTADELVGLLPQDFVPGSKVVVYRVDGSNAGVRLYDEEVVKADDEFDQPGVSSQVVVDFHDALESPATQSEPEANVLGAIGSVASSLRDVDGEKTLIVADSMLSTAGVLQFQSGLLDATPEDVVASVNKDELPDLNGIDVVVYGAGQVRDPQAALTESKLKKLEAIWTLLLEAAGAKSVKFHSQLDARSDVPDLPPVTVIQISQVVAQAPPVDVCTQVIPESLIQFVPDSADFLDPIGARTTIDTVAETMHGCEGTITVTGTTSSWGTPEGRQQTSQERAERVRDELASALGVSPSEIVARGVGMEFPEYVNDRDPSGRLIPVEAVKNRTVRIVAA